MVARACFSVVLGFVLSAVGILLLPDLGRVAGPFVCDGTLAPERRLSGLHYHCVAATDGRVRPVDTDTVILVSLPILTAFLTVPANVLLARGARRAAAAQGTMRADLASAITARAEILRIARHGTIKRQALMRAAELRLVLWVHPPNGRPYEATVFWLVEDHSLCRLSVGAVVPVQINPRRPEHVYPAQPWAHYAWWA